MKRERNEREKQFSFEFEEFIEINQVDITQLPDYIQTMIQTISKQRAEAKINCTPPHYKIVKKRLKRFADIVEDYLLNHFDEKLSNNELEEEDKIIEVPIKKKSKVDEIIDLAQQFGRNYLLSSELKSIGVEIDYSKKEILIEALRLERELATARWYIGTNPKYKEEEV